MYIYLSVWLVLNCYKYVEILETIKLRVNKWTQARLKMLEAKCVYKLYT